MSAAALLGRAERVINEPRPDGLSARMAAFLARQALELIVDQRCTAVGAPAPWASMRSKLAVLRSLDTEDGADSAAIAWSRLSSACHVHAFELQPSVAEIRHLCEVVASLMQFNQG